jgi:hypothetical protein
MGSQGGEVTVNEIIMQYLKSNGYDGLFSEDNCACSLEDLIPCCNSDWVLSCQAGYKHPCPSDCGEHDYHIGIASSPFSSPLD